MAGAPGAPVRPGQDKTQKLLLGACFFCPFFLLLLLLAVDGVAPFGDASLLFADAKGQYVSYFLFYRETLLHGGDLFYTFEKILGGSVSGLYAYYLASPFNLIFLLFPAEKLPLAFDWMVVLKLSCCGLTMGLFLRHRHPLTPFTLLFTTAYALCGYNNAFSWCTMWTDGVILLPLVALGIHHICEGERPWLYLFSLAAAILFCFYIGYMLCLFALLYFLSLTAVRTESLRTLNIRSVGRFALASLLAGALSAVLWVPGVLALRGGMSKSPLEEIQVYTYPACTWILSRLLPGREAGFYDRLVMPLLLGLAALSALLVCAAVWAL